MAELFTSENLIAFVTLALLEIVLGIDNIIFITILASKLPEEQRDKARQIGLSLAVVSRILLLFGINWVKNLTNPLFEIGTHTFAGKDLILLGGGLFLIGKSTYEIHEKLEGEEHHGAAKAVTTLTAVLVQIMIVDVVFSLDSVITAVGISDSLPVMISAIVLATGIMLFFAGAVGRFVEKHPTLKMLALAFLILIGSLLVIEGWVHGSNPELRHAIEELHLKNYAYFAMAFSLGVELLNMRFRKVAEKPVRLHHPRAAKVQGAPVDAAAVAAGATGEAATLAQPQASGQARPSGGNTKKKQPLPNKKKKGNKQ